MASIRKRGSNSYLIVVSRGYDYEGNRLKSVQKTVKPPKEYTPKQAKKWVEDAELSQGLDICDSVIDLLGLLQGVYGFIRVLLQIVVLLQKHPGLIQRRARRWRRRGGRAAPRRPRPAAGTRT